MDDALVADALRACPTDKLSSILQRLCVEDPSFNARLHTAMQGGDSVSPSNRRTNSSRAGIPAHFGRSQSNSTTSSPNSRGTSPQAYTPTSPRHILQLDGRGHYLDRELQYRNIVHNGHSPSNNGHRSRSQKSSRRRMMPGRAVTGYVGRSSSPRAQHVPPSKSPRDSHDDYFGSNPLSVRTAPVSRTLPSLSLADMSVLKGRKPKPQRSLV